tara:strand:- start:2730 stop:3473 length:744 start_codon:yes stop_codon:yes gene_type:complete
MASRSRGVSLALFFSPSICLIAIRLSSPEFSNVLSNDTLAEIALHSLAILIGLIAVYRYFIVRDHEYFRSKIIGRLSKAYRQEDKGLWEKSDATIKGLESKAYTKMRGKRGSSAKSKMLSSIGSLNRESHEQEIRIGDESSYDENESELATENDNSEKDRVSFFDRVKLSLEAAVEKSANRKVFKDYSGKSGEDSESQNWTEGNVEDSIWAIPGKSGISRSARLCSECETYNDRDSNYCSSCGSYLS